MTPSPATGINGRRKRVSDTLKAVFGTIRGAQPLLHSLFGVKTMSGILLGLAFHVKWVTGLGYMGERDVTCGCTCPAGTSGIMDGSFVNSHERHQRFQL